MIARTAFWIGAAAAALGLWTDHRSGLIPPRVAAERLSTTALTATGMGAGDGATPLFAREFLDPIDAAPSVHAATVTMLAGGDLLAAWFAGTREGASDVAIYLARWDRSTGRWGRPWKWLDAASAGRQLGRHVKKLGNPVLHRDIGGRLWAYFVTVSLGGWSGSSISVKWSDDEGASWSQARRLITSPLLNVSTLVRCPPIDLQDGGVLLPTYHELATKYSQLTRLDASGRVVGHQRMGVAGGALQPALYAESALVLHALHRRSSKAPPSILLNSSNDGGQTWTAVRPGALPNPNSSVAVVRRHSGDGAVLAYNPSTDNRRQLALAISEPASQAWRRLTSLPESPEGMESSYPTLIRGRPGEYHLVYTYERRRICHLRFDDAWLERWR